MNLQFSMRSYNYDYDDGSFGVLLFQTDRQENEEWIKTSVDWTGYSVQQTVDGGFIVTGGDGDVLLLKTDSQGNEQWKK